MKASPQWKQRHRIARDLEQADASNWRFVYHKHMTDIAGVPIAMYQVIAPHAPGGFASVAVNAGDAQFAEFANRIAFRAPAMAHGAAMATSLCILFLEAREAGLLEPRNDREREIVAQISARVDALAAQFEKQGLKMTKDGKPIS